MNTQVREQLREFLHVTNALLDSMNTSLLSDSDVLWKYTSYWHFIRKYNQLVEAISQVMTINTIVDYYKLDNIPSSGSIVLPKQKEYFDSVYSNLSILKAFLESKLDVKSDEIMNLTNFLQARLRAAVIHDPERESDIQDVIEQVLVGRGFLKGVDYDRETGRVKVSIKEVIPDFIFPKLGLALEVKFSKDKEKSKAIVDEINADIKAYGKAYAYLLFVVYDLGTIRDEVEFKQGLEMVDSVSVIIVKH